MRDSCYDFEDSNLGGFCCVKIVVRSVSVYYCVTA